jgi:hypothetical protein
MIGLAQYNESCDVIGSTQWSIAFLLLFGTNFMMKENLEQMAVENWMKRLWMWISSTRIIRPNDKQENKKDLLLKCLVIRLDINDEGNE